MTRLHGYQLIEALEREAADIANEDRAQLVKSAWQEIESLIKENRELTEQLEAKNRATSNQ